MRFKFQVALIIVLSFSCTDKMTGPAAPPNLIPEDKMKAVLKDLVILESHIQQKYVQVNRFYEVMVRSGDSLFASYGYSRQQFESSMDYYAADQDKMIQMYSEIKNEIVKPS